MNKGFIIFAFLCVCHALNAQEQTYQPPQNDKASGKQFYAELGGPGVLFSANFDSRFTAGTSLGFGYRAGLGFGLEDYYADYNSEYGYYDNYKTRSYVTIPLGINYVFGKASSSHSFEVGAGATVLTRKVSVFDYDDNEKSGYIIGHASFMYRRSPINGGFTWRIGFTPIIGTSGDIFPSGSIGLGYAF